MLQNYLTSLQNKNHLMTTNKRRSVNEINAGKTAIQSRDQEQTCQRRQSSPNPATFTCSGEAVSYSGSSEWNEAVASYHPVHRGIYYYHLMYSNKCGGLRPQEVPSFGLKSYSGIQDASA